MSFPIVAQVEKVDREKIVSVLCPRFRAQSLRALSGSMLSTITVALGVTDWVRQAGPRVKCIFRNRDNGSRRGHSASAIIIFFRLLCESVQLDFSSSSSFVRKLISASLRLWFSCFHQPIYISSPRMCQFDNLGRKADLDGQRVRGTRPSRNRREGVVPLFGLWRDVRQEPRLYSLFIKLRVLLCRNP